MNFVIFSTASQYEDFHRRPEIEALADRVADYGNKVLFFNRPNFILKGHKKVDKQPYTNIFVRNLYVLCPLSLAFKFSFLMLLLVKLPVFMQLFWHKKQQGLKKNKVINWIYKPDQYLYLKSFKPFVYLHYDNYEGDNHYFFSKDDRFKDTLSKCINNSLFTLFSSAKLLKESTSINKDKIYYYPNAIARSLVSEPSNKLFNKEENNQKVIGFIGQLDNTFDYVLLEKIADNFPNYRIQIIGPIKNSRAKDVSAKFNNIELIGFVDYLSLPQYIQGFDIGICSYASNPFNLYRNPLKITEYFSYALPVVTCKCDMDINAIPLLSVANNGDEFIEKIRYEIESDNNEKKAQRLKYAKENCWDNRIDTLMLLIKESQNAL